MWNDEQKKKILIQESKLINRKEMDKKKKKQHSTKNRFKKWATIFFIIFTFTVHLIGMTMKNDIKW